jgi:hypothetical protein
MQKLKDIVLKSFYKVGHKKLQLYEVPKMVYLESIDFFDIPQILTPSFKLNRPKVHQYYKDTVQNLYDTFDDILSGKLASELDSDSSVMDIPVSQLAIDSMSAIKLISLIKKETNQTVKMEQLFNNHSTLSSIIKNLKEGKQEKEVEIDWKEECSLEISTVKAMRELGKYEHPKQFGHVFLTGATGFFGSFLLQKVLDTWKDCKVTCLVRKCTTEAEAMTKVKNALSTYLCWKDDYESRIFSVNSLKILTKFQICGDLDKPNFGLDDQKFSDLNKSIDLIIHNGCIVNGVLPYVAMKAANVGGTQQVLKLATVAKWIPVCYISSLSAISSGEHETEDYPLRRDYLGFFKGYG